MGATKWTEEQQMAIDTRGCNLLVAAAAGSGKTAVLVQRIIKIITSEQKPVDIDKLLIVTFTNAAAAEMRERIGEAISKALDANPESKLLQRQMTLLNKASITTIHSFCLEVIKSNFHHIDLDPNFRIADETEGILLKQEAINELFERKYEYKEVKNLVINYDDEELEEISREEFLNLVECYGGSKDDIPLQEIVLSLYEFVMSGPWPKKWLEEVSEVFNVGEDFDFGSSKWGIVLKNNLKLDLSAYEKMLRNAVDIIKASIGLEPYLINFEEELEAVRELLKKCERASFEELYEAFLNIEFGRLKSCKKDADKDAQEKVKKIRDEVKDKINSIKKEIFNSSTQEIKKYLQELYPVMKALTNLVLEFEKAYNEKKKERGILDFNDLEHLCLKILITQKDGKNGPSETALEIRERFEEILIDEYQDSNKVQEEILTVISRKYGENPNVFMVGDVKQSIYRFRQAEPGLFLQKYMSYSDIPGEKNRKITLFKNFRSRKEVIDSVNYIFKKIMSENIGEIEYTDREALNLGASYKEYDKPDGVIGGAVELHIIEKGENKENEAFEIDEDKIDEINILEEEEELDGIELEARMVAKRIKELMSQKDEQSFKVFEKNINDYRDVQYRDIVILLRATSKWAPIFMKELERANIPVYADTNSGYFDTIEIQTILSLLQIIDNPMQDIPILAVLRSPIFSFTPEELIDIRINNKELTFFEIMEKLIEDKELLNENEEESSTKLTINSKWYEEESKEIAFDKQEKDGSYVSDDLLIKIKNFMKQFHKWRKKSIHMPIDELIWYLYIDTGYYAYAGAMPSGVQRQANLKILFQRAKQYEKTSYKGLFNFINFIYKLKTSNGDMGSAKILGENDNVVRIMSIHKSKGLEFPVVILAGTGKKFNLMDMNRTILFHQELGLGPNYVDPKRRITYQTILKQAIKKKIKLESLSEEMRVLYVAFTRAKEKLIITGSVGNIKALALKWGSSMEMKAEAEAKADSDTKIPENEIIKGRNFLDWIGLSLIRHKNGSALRELGEIFYDSFSEDSSRWEIKFWNKYSILENKSDNNTIAEGEENDDIDQNFKLNFIEKEESIKETPYKKEINERLDWQYKYKLASILPANLSVTEIKRQAEAEFMEDELATNMYGVPNLIKKPMFLEETKGLTAAERGTALHSVLQHLNLNNVFSRQGIEDQMAEMVYNEIITEEQRKAVNINKIITFFKSELGIRMLKAKKLRREMLFHIELKSTDIYKELPKDIYANDTIMLQGAIDCYFEEDEDIILVDYKTDYVTDENFDIIKERYRMQIEYYAEALRRITKKKVKERYVYLFSNGKIIKY